MKAKPLPDLNTLNQYFTYNAKTGQLINNFTAGKIKKGAVAGTLNYVGYVTVSVNNKRYYAHRIIWMMLTGNDPLDFEIDHINNVRDDNRVENIRMVNRQKNSFNVKLRNTNKSGYKGVFWNKRDKCWTGKVMVDSKTYSTGACPTAEKANELVRELREKLHKDFHNHG